MVKSGKSVQFRELDALRRLIDGIEAPPLEHARQRAQTIRRRRKLAQVAAALAAAVIVVSAVSNLPPGARRGLAPADTPSPVRSYSGSGITVFSVPDPITVPDLAGTIVEFDVDGAGALRTDEGIWAQTKDGGQTWEVIDYIPQNKPTWQYANWTAARATPSGRTWAAGMTAEGLTLAWRDGNAEWTAVKVGAPGESATGTVVGEQGVVMSLRAKEITGIWRYGDGGVHYLSNGGGMTISGEPIWLPDGRLLVADAENEWQISADYGFTWAKAGGNLPVVERLQMTSSGYVAFNLFRGGWVAISIDGLTWQKLPIR
jgi:hypothetical protein